MSGKTGNGRRWTAREDNKIRLAWTGFDPVWMVAKSIDRSVVAVYARAKSLGLPAKITPTQPKGYRGPSHGVGEPIEYIRQQANRDDEYVAACLAQGGFVAAVRIDGKTVHVKPRIAA